MKIAWLVLMLAAIASGDDRVTVIIDGQKIVILNGEEIIRRHGEQRGMDIIYDRARMLVRLGAKEGRIVQ